MFQSISDGQTIWVVSTIAGQAGNPGSVDGIGNLARFNYPHGLAADNPVGTRYPEGRMALT